MDGCISVFLRLIFDWSMRIYSKYKLFIFSSLCILLQFLNAAICSLITLFFKCSKGHQILPQFSTINLTQVMHINIFGRDYLNLNNPIPSKDINLQYIYKAQAQHLRKGREQAQHLMQQKRRTILALHLLKKYPTQDSFLIQWEKSPLPPSVHFK